jgi:hypothetical protein
MVLKWCQLCGMWMYHHAPGHQAWLDRKKEAAAKKKKEEAQSGNPKVHFAGVAQSCDEDFISLGGLSPQS